MGKWDGFMDEVERRAKSEADLVDPDDFVDPGSTVAQHEVPPQVGPEDISWQHPDQLGPRPEAVSFSQREFVSARPGEAVRVISFEQLNVRVPRRWQSQPPTQRNPWLPWLIAGLFLWPLLLVAWGVYNQDARSYRAAMLEFNQGIEPDWYWAGLKFRPLVFNPNAKKPMSNTALVLTIFFGVLCVAFVVGFIASVVS